MQGPGDKPFQPSSPLQQKPDEVQPQVTVGGKRVATSEADSAFHSEAKRPRVSSDDEKRRFDNVSATSSEVLSDSDIDSENDSASEVFKIVGALNSDERSIFDSWSNDIQQEFLELDADERTVFLYLDAQGQDRFMQLNIDEREDFLSLGGDAQSALITLSHEHWQEYHSLSPGERHIMSLLSPSDIEGVLALKPNEREAFLFLNRVATHDGVHSLLSVQGYFKFNKPSHPDYGTSLMLLSALMHRHHFGAEEMFSCFALSARECNPSADKPVDAEKILQAVQAVGMMPEKMDNAFKLEMGGGVEEIMTRFWINTRNDGLLNIIHDIDPDE